MKKINLLYFLFSFIFLFNTNNELKAQTNACSGTIQASALGNWGAGTQVGNGTPGNIRVCITANALVSAGMSCSNAQLVVSTGNGVGIQVIWTELTANGTCFTFATGTGFGWLSKNCFGAGSNATITWTTVDGSGNPACPTCFDGIQNGTETGIDCGGSCPACSVTPCTNGIQDGTETGIDCGGSCIACPTCFDGIQNGTETGVDCGGSCALVCTTNGTIVPSTCGACPPAATAVVYPTNCAQVGTSAYNLNSPQINFVSCGAYTAPVPAVSCGAVTNGTWVHVDLAAGVTQVQLAFNGGSVANGNNNTWAAAYQGTGCGALSPVAGGCQNSVFFVSGVQYVNQVFFTGLNPNQDLWIFMYNDNGKAFNLNFSLIGTPGAPSNTSCATASTAIGNACNLGAPGATFTTPGAAGQGCSGGGWGSNENTTFYSFTPTATTASLTIGGITCNAGSSGNAQFAVWTSCANVGTYGAGFLGCAVGTGTINLTGLTVGQTYYIAADGFAGDNCTWNFTGNNIVLPIELTSLNATYVNESVLLNWGTASEKDNDYFTVERTIDGVNFEYVTTVKGAGNSTSLVEYDAIDVRPLSGTSYYRLKQADFNGEFKYSELVRVKNDNDIITVFPNPASDNVEVSFNTNTTEAADLKVIDVTTGKLVISQEINPKKGMNVIKLNTSDLSKGLYFVTLTNRYEVLKTKFIKE